MTLVNLDPSSLLKILISKNAICQRIKVIVLIKGNQIAIVLKRGSYIMLSAEKLKIINYESLTLKLISIEPSQYTFIHS